MGKKIKIIFSFIYLNVVLVYSQESLFNLNYYLPVIKVSNDTLFVKIISNYFDNFNIGDTIFIYQTKGASFLTENGDNFGDLISLNCAGCFEFNTIKSKSQNYIIVDCPLKNNYNYLTGNVQVIKIKTFRHLVLNTFIEVPNWDYINGIGGIFVLLIDSLLELNKNIVADGKGFVCYKFDYGTNPLCADIHSCDEYWYSVEGRDSSGLKGEGIGVCTDLYARGRGKVINGGGAGNGRFSGGGGGGNGGQGGNGGKETNMCVDPMNYGGFGGSSITHENGLIKNIFFGGGAGTSTILSYYPDTFSDQGNGGGAILILTNKFKTNSFRTISANGNNGILFYDFTGSIQPNLTLYLNTGGGAGGSIFLWSNIFDGMLNLFVEGGKGGDGLSYSSGNNLFSTGSGGGGGGGVVYFNANTMSQNSILNVYTEGGMPGSADDGYSGSNGTDGNFYQNTFSIDLGCLKINNYIYPSDSIICDNENLPIIFGTYSNLIYSYEWQKSYDSINWELILESPNSYNYYVLELSQTTFYRRIVKYIGGESDTSNVVKILKSKNLHLVDIYHNTCLESCKGRALINIIEGFPPYSFMWSCGDTTNSIINKCANTYTFTITDKFNCQFFGEVQIKDTNLFSLSVLIENPDCEYSPNGRINIVPQGGIPPYNPPLIDTINLYKGIYSFSFVDSLNCAIDTTINLLPKVSITNNSIFIIDTVFYICDTINILGDLIIIEGEADSIKYKWQIKKFDSSEWLDSFTTLSTFQLIGADTSFFIRRIVIAYKDGFYCEDTSNVLTIYINKFFPIVTTNDTLICNFSLYDTIYCEIQGDNYTWQYYYNNEWHTDSSFITNYFLPINLPAGIINIRCVVKIGNCFYNSNTITLYVSKLLSEHSIIQPTCNQTNDGILKIKISNGFSPFTIIINDSLIYTNIYDTIFNYSTGPDTIVYVVNDIFICQSDTFTVIITPLIEIKNKIKVISNLNFCNTDTFVFGNLIPLTIENGEIQNIIWQIRYVSEQDWINICESNCSETIEIFYPDTSFFIRRIVEAYNNDNLYCTDTSNTIFVNIKQIIVKITTDKQKFCYYEDPDTIFCNYVSNLSSIKWYVYYNNSWHLMPDTNHYFIPTFFDDTIKVRCRVDSADCFNFSNILTLYKINDINNLISFQADNDTLYTCGITDVFIYGNFDTTYQIPHFLWIYSYDKVNWFSFDNSNQQNWIYSITDYDTIHFIRLQKIYECIDTSNILTLIALPSIMNNYINFENTLDTILSVCQNDSINILGSYVEGGNQVYEYLWIVSNDLINWYNAPGINNQISYSFFENLGINDSVYYIKRIVSSSVCTDSSNTLTIKFNILPDNVIAVTDSFYCKNDTMSVCFYEIINTSDYNVNYQWQVFIGSWINIPNAINSNYCFKPTNYTLIRRVINKGNCYLPSNEILVFYNNYYLNYELLTDTILCSSDDTIAKLKLIPSGIPPYTINLKFNENEYVTIITNETELTYTIEGNKINEIKIISFKDNSECQADTINETFLIHVFKKEEAKCITYDTCGLSTIAIGNEPNYGIGKWIFSEPIVIENPNNYFTVVTSDMYGRYEIKWQIENGPCLSHSSCIVTFFEEPQKPEIGDTIYIDEFKNITISPFTNFVGIGNWNILEGNITYKPLDSIAIIITSLSEGINSIEWSIKNGTCPIKSDTLYIIFTPLFIPEGFTPNADGINDLFEIKGLLNDCDYKLIVFDRWGNIVYKNDNYNNNWDGKDLNNNQLPEDTYFYLFYKNNVLIKKGFVVIKR